MNTQTIFDVISQGNLTRFQSLVQTKGVEQLHNQDGYSVLTFSVLKHMSTMVQMLAQLKYPFNNLDLAGRHPLTVSNADMVQVLVEAGSDVDGENADECTALMSAAADGRIALVRELFKFGANPNIQDSFGYNALMCAIQSREPRTMQMIITHPLADLQAINKDGQNAFMMVQDFESKEMTLAFVTALALRVEKYWPIYRLGLRTA